MTPENRAQKAIDDCHHGLDSACNHCIAAAIRAAMADARSGALDSVRSIIGCASADLGAEYTAGCWIKSPRDVLDDIKRALAAEGER